MEVAYLNLLRDVLQHGQTRTDRTGIGTLSVFGRQIRCHLGEGFPLLTTKKVGFRAVAGELLWFLEGSGDERRLAEITYGTRDGAQKTIWSPNAEHTTGSKFTPLYPGDLGRIYGVQWRSWRSNTTEIDQLQGIIDRIRTDPADRRLILSAWNPGELDQMALPPCHLGVQFHVNESRRELDCMVQIRSWDVPLGGPFNIASYALLTHMMAQVTSYAPGELIITAGDVHCYLDQLDGVREQLSRSAFSLPKLRMNPDVRDIDDFKINDFEIIGYNHHPAIKMKMAC